MRRVGRAWLVALAVAVACVAVSALAEAFGLPSLPPGAPDAEALGVAPGVAPVEATGLRFRGVTVDDGLPQSTVTAFAQDATGFLWIGTEGGLARYDGYAVRTYGANRAGPGALPQAFVHALLTSRDGTLWVGTYGGGLARYVPARDGFATADPVAAACHPRVSRLREDADGGLWVGTVGGGVCRYDPATGAVTRPPPFALPFDAQVQALALDAEGALWIGTHGDGLARVDARTQRHRPLPPAVAAVTDTLDVEALALRPGGGVWLGTAHGRTFRLAPDAAGTWRLETLLARGEAVDDLLVDADGTLWVATRGGGLVRRRPDGATATWRARPDRDGTLPDNRLRALFRDRSGLLWLGTWGRGAAAARRSPFRAVTPDPGAPDPGTPGGLADASLAGLAQDERGRLWLGTYGAGVEVYDPAAGRVVDRLRADAADPARRLPHATVYDVHLDGDSVAWLATGGGGLARLDRRTSRLATLRADPADPASLGGNVVSHLYEDPQGALWAVSYGGGPCRLDRQTLRFACLFARLPDALRAAHGLTGDLVAYRMHQAPDGRFWVSLWGEGVVAIDFGPGGFDRAPAALAQDGTDDGAPTITRYDSDPGDLASLGQNSVVSFFDGPEGRLWLGTYGGGLSRFDAGLGTFQTFTRGDGLPDNTVYEIRDDGDGRLWMSTNRGLACLTLASGRIDTYDVRDGLPASEFNGRSALVLRDGRLAFGSAGGLALFNPAALAPSAYAPPVVLTDLRVLDQPVDLHALSATASRDEAVGGEAVGEATDEAAGLQLGYRENFLSFRYAALDFADPASVRYAYRVDGVDGKWVEAGDRRFASYPDLDPGRYVVRVRATNRDGIWSPHEVALPVTIVPPVWQRAWFQAGGALVLLAGFAGGVRFLAQRRLRRAVQRLETERRLHRERERISRDLHDHVGAQLSTIVSGLELVHLCAEHDRPGEMKRHLAALGDDARTTITQLRETIWALHHERVTVAAFAEQVRRYARQQTRYRARPAVHVTAHDDDARADDDDARTLSPLHALNLFRIAQEALTNALKYADANAVRITVRADAAGTVTLTVADDGAFRPTDDARHESPGDGPPGDGQPGDGLSGYGLAGMRQRARDLGGTFALTTDDGTTVRVTVPTDGADDGRGA